MMTEIKNKVIVIGGDHHNTLWTVRSLGFTGVFPDLIIVGAKESFVAKSKYVSRSWLVKRPEEILNILRTQFDKEINPPIIISSNDKCSDLLDRNYSWLSESFLLSSIDGEEGKISYWMDKSRMLQAAEKAGFNVPKTWKIDLSQNDNVDLLISENVVFPCIVKPCKSCDGAKTDFRISNCREELRAYLNELRKHISIVLVQEYLKPDYEISLVGVNLRNSKKNIIAGIVKKISTCGSLHNMGMQKFACLQQSLSPWVDKKTMDDFFSQIRYKGIYSVEYFINHDKVYFLEINLRTDGNMFLYTGAGINLPSLWVNDVVGNDISSLKQQVTGRVYGMVEISYLKYFKWKYFCQGIRDWWRTDCFALFSRKDIKPFIFKFIYAKGLNL